MTTNEQYRVRLNARLDAKVAAVNKANAEANRLRPLFIEAFRPFVGKKILTHSGLAQKPKEIVAKLLPPWKPDGYTTPTTYREPSNFSLRFTVKVCVNTPTGDGCAYHEATFTVGELDGYNLKDITEPAGQLRTDYTAAEVRQLRKNIDEAEKAKHDAESKLSPFSRYDQ